MFYITAPNLHIDNGSSPAERAASAKLSSPKSYVLWAPLDAARGIPPPPGGGLRPNTPTSNRTASSFQHVLLNTFFFINSCTVGHGVFWLILDFRWTRILFINSSLLDRWTRKFLHCGTGSLSNNSRLLESFDSLLFFCVHCSGRLELWNRVGDWIW